MLRIENLKFSYFKKGIPALDGLTAAVEPGIYLLAGENGAGKTTLLHILAGTMTPTEGKVSVNGGNPASDCPDLKGTTFLLEENTSFPMKNIRAFARIHSPFYPDFSQVRFENNLRAFGLTGFEPAKSLSLGTRKKALLAYTLALGVNTLLLDEPTNALDIESKETLKRLIAANVGENQTLIVSTHTVSELENLFDGAIMLRGGRLLWAGTEEDATSRIAFRKTRAEDPDALYSEKGLGVALSIIPTTEEEPTRADWRLLYSALHSPKADSILRLLRR